MPGTVRFAVDPAGKAGFVRKLNSRSSWSQEIAAATKRKMNAELRRIETEVVDEVERRVSQLYQPRTDPQRRKGENDVHLHGSFRAEWQGSTFPLTLRLWSEADDAKVMALNYGANQHEIRPRESGGWLWLPRAGLGQSFAALRRSQGRPVRAAPGQRLPAHSRFIQSPAAGVQARAGSLTKKRSVQHPGIQASYFMELALEVVVERVLRHRVRLPR